MMKKAIKVLSIVAILLLIACFLLIIKTVKLNKQESLVKAAEQEAVDAFSLIANDYVKNGIPKDIYGYGTPLREAEDKIYDLYKTNSSNITISNYNWFCISVFYYVAGMPFAEDNAKYTASLIDVSKECEYGDVLQDYVNRILGNQYQSIREETLRAKKEYESMSTAEKAQVMKYIYDRYDYYDAKEGKYCGDKYSDTIWREVKQKYGLLYYMISYIWSDSETMKYYANHLANK